MQFDLVIEKHCATARYFCVFITAKLSAYLFIRKLFEMRFYFLGREKMVKFLIQNGANPNVKDETGATSLHVAAGSLFSNKRLCLKKKTTFINKLFLL